VAGNFAGQEISKTPNALVTVPLPVSIHLRTAPANGCLERTSITLPLMLCASKGMMAMQLAANNKQIFFMNDVLF
jgi:hypothetical protein